MWIPNKEEILLSRSTQICIRNHLQNNLIFFKETQSKPLFFFLTSTHLVKQGYLLWLLLKCGKLHVGSLHTYLSGNKWDTIYSGAAREHLCDRLNPGCSYRLRVYCIGEGGQSTVILANVFLKCNSLRKSDPTVNKYCYSSNCTELPSNVAI